MAQGVNPPLGEEARKKFKEYKRQARKLDRGLILVNTGEGKGKTTAALGVALRAIGTGWKVAVLQFLKGQWKTGELKAAKRLEPDLVLKPMGKGFTWDKDRLDEDIEAAREAWQEALRIMNSGEYRLVVLDEINYVLSYGFLSVEEVIEGLKNRPKHVNVILTGRNAPQEIIDMADTVTEMRKVKHAYDRGILAQQGIDF